MAVSPATSPILDVESREWLRDLRAGGPTGDDAVARLHALLLRAAAFEVSRRAAQTAGDADDFAFEAADEAVIRVCSALDDFRGDSRFTTWAYKFAVHEASVQLRRGAWRGRELPTEPVAMTRLADLALEPLREEIERLAPPQRLVLLAVAVSGVPIDVLAERLGTTRGALYATLREARDELRRRVAAAGT
jgi:RNA polymerase sigma-70 factor (ECF subfamily)